MELRSGVQSAVRGGRSSDLLKRGFSSSSHHDVEFWQAVKNNQYENEPSLAACGISTEKQFMQITGRVLDPPKITGRVLVRCILEKFHTVRILSCSTPSKYVNSRLEEQKHTPAFHKQHHVLPSLSLICEANPKGQERFRTITSSYYLGAHGIITLGADDIRDPEISALIAAKMREFHSLDMPSPITVLLWPRIRRWLRKAKGLCSRVEIKEFGLDTLDDDIQILEKELTRDDQEIVFCHNDLQYGNIMMDEETKSLTLIDYEYSSYNPIAYDIANHFCEMAADYHSDEPHILDYSKYPDLEERRRFIRSYLGSSGDEPCESEVENLIQDAERYTLANHLFWGLWGIISAHVNKIEFDYMEYARQRFRQYHLRKPQLLGTSLVPLNDDDNGF